MQNTCSSEDAKRGTSAIQLQGIQHSPARSSRKTLYFSRSVCSSRTTSSRLPVKLAAWTTATIAASNKESNHLMIMNWRSMTYRLAAAGGLDGRRMPCQDRAGRNISRRRGAMGRASQQQRRWEARSSRPTSDERTADSQSQSQPQPQPQATPAPAFRHVRLCKPPLLLPALPLPPLGLVPQARLLLQLRRRRRRARHPPYRAPDQALPGRGEEAPHPHDIPRYVCRPARWMCCNWKAGSSADCE
jgi:hypothetical protein